MKEQITLFKQYLQALGYGKSTVQSLPEMVADYYSFNGKNESKKAVENYLEYLQDRPSKRGEGGLSSSYIAQHHYALKIYFGWQLKRGKIKSSPLVGIKRPQVDHPEVLYYSEGEIARLKMACETEKELAALALFYGCGLRRSEAEKLEIKDIDFANKLLQVRKGKGGVSRKIPMSPGTKKALLDQIKKEESGHVISNRLGRKMQGASYIKMLEKAAKKAGWEQRVRLHSFRHSIATHLLKRGMPVEQLQRFLGHKQLESTMVYVRVENSQLWTLSDT